MTQAPASRRALRYALGLSPQPSAAPPAIDGYSVARRTLAGLLGVRLPDRSRSAGNAQEAMDADTPPFRIVRDEQDPRPGVHERTASGPMGALPPELRLPGILRLPRFDRAALRTAGTVSARRLSRETSAGGVRYILRDAGRDRLEIVAE